jgi:hypothetical protein
VVLNHPEHHGREPLRHQRRPSKILDFGLAIGRNGNCRDCRRAQTRPAAAESDPCRGTMGNCRGLWRVETKVSPSQSAARRRAFNPGRWFRFAKQALSLQTWPRSTLRSARRASRQGRAGREGPPRPRRRRIRPEPRRPRASRSRARAEAGRSLPHVNDVPAVDQRLAFENRSAS